MHGQLADGWRAFLDDCRTRLPPTHPLNDTKLRATVTFVASRQGTITQRGIAKTSGHIDFDKAALEVSHDVARFPQAPTALLSDDGFVHVTWLFARDQRRAGVATAQVQRVLWSPDRAIPSLLAAGNVTGAAQRLASVADDDTAADLPNLAKQLAVAAIREALRSKHDQTQRAAVLAAAEKQLSNTAAELRMLTTNVVDPQVRVDAIRALGQVGGHAAKSLLLSILRGNKSTFPQSAAAASALSRLGYTQEVTTAAMADLERGTDEATKRALAIAAIAPVPAAAATLTRLVTSKRAPRADRVSACHGLGMAAASGDRKVVLRGLRAGLNTRSAALRAACAHAVGLAAQRKVIDRVAYWRLVELLRDRDERVRAAAVTAAVDLEPTRVVRELYVLRKERAPTVRAAIATALAKVPGAEAAGHIRRLTKDKHARVRAAAVRSLLSHPDRGKPTPEPFLSDSDPAVRVAAISSLADQAALHTLMADNSKEIQKAAWMRWVEIASKQQVLGEFSSRLATADPGSEQRVWLSRGWLKAMARP